MNKRARHATRRQAAQRCTFVLERLRAGWTHQEIADLLQVDRSTVTYYASSRRCKHRPAA
jgi:DNA-binding NarL/FixJ family response regulator